MEFCLYPLLALTFALQCCVCGVPAASLHHGVMGALRHCHTPPRGWGLKLPHFTILVGALWVVQTTKRLPAGQCLARLGQAPHNRPVFGKVGFDECPKGARSAVSPLGLLSSLGLHLHPSPHGPVGVSWLAVVRLLALDDHEALFCRVAQFCPACVSTQARGLLLTTVRAGLTHTCGAQQSAVRSRSAVQANAGYANWSECVTIQCRSS